MLALSIASIASNLTLLIVAACAGVVIFIGIQTWGRQ